MSRYRSHNMGNCSTCLRMRSSPSKKDDDRNAAVLQPLAALRVTSVDFERYLNSREHSTDMYHTVNRPNDPKLVIRRGHQFRLTIALHRQYNKADDLINLVFFVKDVKKPSYATNTEIVLPVLDDGSLFNSLTSLMSMENAWSAKLASVDRNKVQINVNISGNATIGEWMLRVETMSRLRGNESQFVYNCQESLYMLFNPWSKRDAVYMKDKDGRREYVLNDTGIMWRGIDSVLRPTPWNFSQFEENVLECSLYVLSHIGRLSPYDLHDPIKVSRHISQIVNSLDENGIMVGKWDGDYSGGKAPTSWMGSFSIMNKYFKTKRPVKYGQCWIFAGVATTICRSLGIPCRPVTNYQSAHDTHMSLTVDRFFNEDLETVDSRNQDSIWNFHVWNEVWMTRPDLASSSYDGWQVIDATPQEMSDGLFRCGPTSVEAVKRGDVVKSYDTKFVFAEVNADEIFWLHQGDKQPVKLLKHKTTTVGKKMSTKAIGSSNREDITDSYKYQEKSPEEREVMLKALRLCKNLFTSYYLNEKFEDIRFELILLDDIVVGSPFTIRLQMQNKSGKVYSVASVLDVRTTFYTGTSHSLVKKDRQETKAAPKSDSEIFLEVTYDDYAKHLVDQSSFHISVLATVQETQFQYHAADDFRVKMPDIRFEIERDIIQGRAFACTVYFTNPLPRDLTKGLFRIEGPALGSPLKIPLNYTVGPGEEARAMFELVPSSAGIKTISARFESRELRDVDGFRSIRVAAEMDNDINSNTMTRTRY